MMWIWTGSISWTSPAWGPCQTEGISKESQHTRREVEWGPANAREAVL